MLMDTPLQGAVGNGPTLQLQAGIDDAASSLAPCLDGNGRYNLTEREIDYLISITPSPFILSSVAHTGVKVTGHQEKAAYSNSLLARLTSDNRARVVEQWWH